MGSGRNNTIPFEQSRNFKFMRDMVKLPQACFSTDMLRPARASVWKAWKSPLSSGEMIFLPIFKFTQGMKGFVSILILGWVAFSTGCTDSAPLSDRELATTVLAQESAKAVRPKKVLVISNPFSQQPGSPEQVYDFEKAGIAGLQEGFGKDVKIDIVFPQLKPEVLKDPRSVQVDPQTTTPLSFLVGEQAFSD